MNILVKMDYFANGERATSIGIVADGCSFRNPCGILCRNQEYEYVYGEFSYCVAPARKTFDGEPLDMQVIVRQARKYSILDVIQPRADWIVRFSVLRRDVRNPIRPLSTAQLRLADSIIEAESEDLEHAVAAWVGLWTVSGVTGLDYSDVGTLAKGARSIARQVQLSTSDFKGKLKRFLPALLPKRQERTGLIVVVTHRGNVSLSIWEDVMKAINKQVSAEPEVDILQQCFVLPDMHPDHMRIVIFDCSNVGSDSSKPAASASGMTKRGARQIADESGEE
ncbi:MAG: hypothetical protein AAB229_08600 [Candidatus Hydrogenedentota bacterium]